MSFGGIDHDRSQTSQQITGDQRAASTFENTDMPAGVSGRVKDLQRPTWFSRKLDLFVLLESTIDINDTLEIMGRDGMRSYLDAALLSQMIRAAYMVTM